MKNRDFILVPTELYPVFWEFAYKRQKVFQDRLDNPMFSSLDPIIAKYKFTNAYRILDRTTQYLVKNIINNSISYSNEDLLFRILLFKTFNKSETWERLQTIVGNITWTSFDMEKYKSAFEDIIRNKKTIYSAAYIMPSGVTSFGSKKKYENHLMLLQTIMNDNAASKIIGFSTMEEVYNYLKSFPMIGSFLAYQYVIDLNYSRLINFDENDFVVPGPGAIRGIKKAFGDNGIKHGSQIIKYLTTFQQEESSDNGFLFPSLKGHNLKMIDIQNLFCEFDKYTREYSNNLEKTIAEKNHKRIKQKFMPRLDIIEYRFPEKWGIIEVK